MSQKTKLVPLSPNEEAELKKKQTAELRKARLLQIREQEKKIAAEKRQKLMEIEANQKKESLRLAKEQMLKEREQSTLELQNKLAHATAMIGSGHQMAVEAQKEKEESASEEYWKWVANAKKESERFMTALEQARFDREESLRPFSDQMERKSIVSQKEAKRSYEIVNSASAKFQKEFGGASFKSDYDHHVATNRPKSGPKVQIKRAIYSPQDFANTYFHGSTSTATPPPPNFRFSEFPVSMGDAQTSIPREHFQQKNPSTPADEKERISCNLPTRFQEDSGYKNPNFKILEKSAAGEVFVSNPHETYQKMDDVNQRFFNAQNDVGNGNGNGKTTVGGWSTEIPTKGKQKLVFKKRSTSLEMNEQKMSVFESRVVSRSDSQPLDVVTVSAKDAARVVSAERKREREEREREQREKAEMRAQKALEALRAEKEAASVHEELQLMQKADRLKRQREALEGSRAIGKVIMEREKEKKRKEKLRLEFERQFGATEGELTVIHVAPMPPNYNVAPSLSNAQPHLYEDDEIQSFPPPPPPQPAHLQTRDGNALPLPSVGQPPFADIPTFHFPKTVHFNPSDFGGLLAPLDFSSALELPTENQQPSAAVPTSFSVVTENNGDQMNIPNEMEGGASQQEQLGGREDATTSAQQQGSTVVVVEGPCSEDEILDQSPGSHQPQGPTEDSFETSLSRLAQVFLEDQTKTAAAADQLPPPSQRPAEPQNVLLSGPTFEHHQPILPSFPVPLIEIERPKFDSSSSGVGSSSQSKVSGDGSNLVGPPIFSPEEMLKEIERKQKEVLEAVSEAAEASKQRLLFGEQEKQKEQNFLPNERVDKSAEQQRQNETSSIGIEISSEQQNASVSSGGDAVSDSVGKKVVNVQLPSASLLMSQDRLVEDLRGLQEQAQRQSEQLKQKTEELLALKTNFLQKQALPRQQQQPTHEGASLPISKPIAPHTPFLPSTSHLATSHQTLSSQISKIYSSLPHANRISETTKTNARKAENVKSELIQSLEREIRQLQKDQKNGGQHDFSFVSSISSLSLNQTTDHQQQRDSSSESENIHSDPHALSISETISSVEDSSDRQILDLSLCTTTEEDEGEGELSGYSEFSVPESGRSVGDVHHDSNLLSTTATSDSMPNNHSYTTTTSTSTFSSPPLTHSTFLSTSQTTTTTTPSKLSTPLSSKISGVLSTSSSSSRTHSLSASSSDTESDDTDGFVWSDKKGAILTDSPSLSLGAVSLDAQISKTGKSPKATEDVNSSSFFSLSSLSTPSKTPTKLTPKNSSTQKKLSLWDKYFSEENSVLSSSSVEEEAASFDVSSTTMLQDSRISQQSSRGDRNSEILRQNILQDSVENGNQSGGSAEPKAWTSPQKFSQNLGNPPLDADAPLPTIQSPTMLTRTNAPIPSSTHVTSAPSSAVPVASLRILAQAETQENSLATNPTHELTLTVSDSEEGESSSDDESTASSDLSFLAKRRGNSSDPHAFRVSKSVDVPHSLTSSSSSNLSIEPNSTLQSSSLPSSSLLSSLLSSLSRSSALLSTPSPKPTKSSQPQPAHLSSNALSGFQAVQPEPEPEPEPESDTQQHQRNVGESIFSDFEAFLDEGRQEQVAQPPSERMGWQETENLLSTTASSTLSDFSELHEQLKAIDYSFSFSSGAEKKKIIRGTHNDFQLPTNGGENLTLSSHTLWSSLSSTSSITSSSESKPKNEKEMRESHIAPKFSTSSFSSGGLVDSESALEQTISSIGSNESTRSEKNRRDPHALSTSQKSDAALSRSQGSLGGKSSQGSRGNSENQKGAVGPPVNLTLSTHTLHTEGTSLSISQKSLKTSSSEADLNEQSTSSSTRSSASSVGQKDLASVGSPSSSPRLKQSSTSPNMSREQMVAQVQEATRQLLMKHRTSKQQNATIVMSHFSPSRKGSETIALGSASGTSFSPAKKPMAESSPAKPTLEMSPGRGNSEILVGQSSSAAPSSAPQTQTSPQKKWTLSELIARSSGTLGVDLTPPKTRKPRGSPNSDPTTSTTTPSSSDLSSSPFSQVTITNHSSSSFSGLSPAKFDGQDFSAVSLSFSSFDGASSSAVTSESESVGGRERRSGKMERGVVVTSGGARSDPSPSKTSADAEFHQPQILDAEEPPASAASFDISVGLPSPTKL